MSTKFLRGDARLTEMLADTQTRAEVRVILDEMRQIDRAHKVGRDGEDAGEGTPPRRS